MSSRFSAVLHRGASSKPAPPASAPAARVQRRWWADTRVIVGVLVIVVCTLIGARVVSMGADQVQVWQVQRDVSAGAVLAPEDVAAVGVAPDLAGAYLPVGSLPGEPLAMDIRAGEMLPKGALSDGVARDVRWVTLPIEPLHAPADLAAGDRVDVWSTPDPSRAFGSDAVVRPILVLPNALVASIDVDARGFAGDYGVVVEVAPDQAESLLTAVRGGLIDLVRVPLGAAR